MFSAHRARLIAVTTGHLLWPLRTMDDHRQHALLQQVEAAGGALDLLPRGPIAAEPNALLTRGSVLQTKVPSAKQQWECTKYVLKTHFTVELPQVSALFTPRSESRVLSFSGLRSTFSIPWRLRLA